MNSKHLFDKSDCWNYLSQVCYLEIIWSKISSRLFSKIIQSIVNLEQFIEKNPQKGMTTVKSCFPKIWTFTVQNFPSIYQHSSDFVKQLFRIQMQKRGNILLWNQVKSRMEDCYSELVFILFLEGSQSYKLIFVCLL